MTGMAMMIKAFGINISEDNIKAIEAILPTIPQRLNDASGIIQTAISNFDARLQALENNNMKTYSLLETILVEIRNVNSNRAATIGATGGNKVN